MGLAGGERPRFPVPPGSEVPAGFSWCQARGADESGAQLGRPSQAWVQPRSPTANTDDVGETATAGKAAWGVESERWFWKSPPPAVGQHQEEVRSYSLCSATR